MMIDQYFNFFNTLSSDAESVCNIILYLQWKKLFYNIWRLVAPSMVKVNVSIPINALLKLCEVGCIFYVMDLWGWGHWTLPCHHQPLQVLTEQLNLRWRLHWIGTFYDVFVSTFHNGRNFVWCCDLFVKLFDVYRPSFHNVSCPVSSPMFTHLKSDKPEVAMFSSDLIHHMT